MKIFKSFIVLVVFLISLNVYSTDYSDDSFNEIVRVFHEQISNLENSVEDIIFLKTLLSKEFATHIILRGGTITRNQLADVDFSFIAEMLIHQPDAKLRIVEQNGDITEIPLHETLIKSNKEAIHTCQKAFN